jgi:alkylation response protein AidB-like acyl-CoA dehydrogenase
MEDYMSMDHLRFVLHELIKVEGLAAFSRYSDYDKDSFDLLLQSTKTFADQSMYPVFKEMDAEPARFEDGKIIVHKAVGEIMKYCGANGAIGATFDYAHGGMQIPHVIASALAHIGECANNSLTGYTGLTGGSANLIVSFGEQKLIDMFVPKMLSGEWGGTMCLTEPQAGSSLSDITTSASPNEDGSYNISGQKIFISGGDHEYCENFVHLVLARIDGAPMGTKGISLFAVPKYRTGDNGLESNDVITAADFQKMGQRGYCTTHLVFGENNNCKGWLVGPENKGLKCMFQMMNGARIDVGLTAASTATAAYYASLQYANERPQGRRILSGGIKNKEADQTLIIKHPDVRRMLLFQRAITEGAVSLLLHASYYEDLSKVSESEEERTKYHDLLELITPIAKTYPSEMGILSISNGLQVLGGYGYCTDFPLEQYFRDIRIMAIYEGTTGIQSLDLLGRKIVMKNGEAMKLLTKEMIQTIREAENHDDLKTYAGELKSASKKLEDVLMHLLQYAMKGDHERYIADATPFMFMMGHIVIAWQWLKMATQAKVSLLTGNGEFESSFYDNKIHTMRFFYKYELTKIDGLARTIMHPDALTIPEENKAILAH